MNRPRLRIALAACLWLLGTRAVEAQEPVWIEGEDTSSADVKLNVAGWGRKAILSGEKWLHLAVDADKVEKDVPAEGATISYKFAAKTDGTYQVWDRVGFEFVRSPFSWRVDGGAWTIAKPSDLTTDLMELDFFCEVAWLRLGDTKLKAGPHTLQIRVNRTKDASGKTERLLYASDAIVLHPGEFRPDGKFPPGVDGRDDRDKAAEKTVFRLPESKAPGERASVALKGLWEIARDDEQMPGEVAEPIKALPAHPVYRAIDVPGDKNTLRPDLVFAHRVWYRTRVEVPKSAEGRSFLLVFPQNNLNTTVYVNGHLCGFDKNPFARVQIDLTGRVRPGENVISVGIRDAWYGRSGDPRDPMKLRKTFNLPIKFFGEGFQDLAYPIWNQAQSGILATPELVSVEPAHAADVFVRPSVATKTLAADVSVKNHYGRSGSSEITVTCEALDASGKVAATLPPVKKQMQPGASETFAVEGPWASPKLWWPDDPVLYRLRTTVFARASVVGFPAEGRGVDVTETPFGFREWSIRGKDFLLNGVPWHGWADTHLEESPEKWLDFHRKTNQTFMRFWGTSWQNMPPEEALSFFDRSGVVVRRSGILDGEAIGYNAIENDENFRKRYNSPIKMDLMNNWRDQMVAQVKGERNHPSVMLWSIENEYLYINCINLFGDKMDLFEAETAKTAQAVKRADPTRPSMTDGGGATKSNAMPVHGDHYTAGPFAEYPSLAYTPNTKGGGRGRWEWDQKRPRFIGEELFAEGFNPAYSYFGGEEVFSGKAGSRRAVGLLVRMMTEGARWTGNGAIHFWQGPGVAVGQYDANAPRAVFCRQWDWTFGVPSKNKRTYKIFNDTHSDEPITFSRTLSFNGRGRVKESTHHVPPGGAEEIDEPLDVGPPTNNIPMFAREGDDRAEGELVLALKVGGREVFRDVKAVSAIRTPGKVASVAPSRVAVFDPHGSARAFLRDHRPDFTPVDSLDKVPDSARVVLIGKDALSAEEAGSTKVAALALSGKRVVVLEQAHPLRYQALGPAEMEPATNEGRIAFVEDAGHPAMKGLKSKDFFTWGPGEVVSKDAYLKPTKGARSLVQCGEKLAYSALAEVPVGEGLLLVSQLRIGGTLADNAVARTLLANLVDHADRYVLTFRPVASVVEGSPSLASALREIGLKSSPESDPVAAISGPARLVVMHASAENLARLAASRPALDKFKASGGYLVLNGLAPEGLESFNKIVGQDHMIRPFRRERVTFPASRDALGAGLSLSDVALYSSERIFPWQEGNYVASDTFSFAVDIDDVAPFARLFDRDGFAANMVNGFVSSDAWKYIVNVPAPANPPLDFVLDLPKTRAVAEVEWVGNTFYYPVTRFSLVFDGRDTATFPVKPNNDPQTFAVEPPRSGRAITLRLDAWDKPPGKGAVTGLDNIRLRPVRSADFAAKVRPLVSNGTLVHYPSGPGGIVLANLLFKPSEEVPGNAERKRSALATILRNLNAPFASGKTIIAGAKLDYAPVDLSKQANAFRTDRGWFGDPSTTFKDLPTGRQVFAGVPFQVYDFPTSPVPTVVMLGGPGVPNNLPDAVRDIPVNRKAQALFFLQAARIDKRRDEGEIRDRKRPELARYLVTYADGKTEDVPILSEIDVEDYRLKSPSSLPGALLGWSRPYPNSDLSASAYVKTWTNPRPDVPIKSVSLLYGPGPDRRGVPALIAITAASTR